jgi:hypothetical protein
MHDEETEAVLDREVLECDGAVKALGMNAFPPVLVRDDGRSILLFQRHLNSFVIRLRMANDAMTRDGERCQEI